MPKITFIKEKKTIEVAPGANLRTEARKAGIQLYKGIHRPLNCHGLGACGSCRVLVKKGQENLSERGKMERFTTESAANPEAFFAYIGHESEMRLACQCSVNGDVEVETQAACNWHGDKFFA